MMASVFHQRSYRFLTWQPPFAKSGRKLVIVAKPLNTSESRYRYIKVHDGWGKRFLLSCMFWKKFFLKYLWNFFPSFLLTFPFYQLPLFSLFEVIFSITFNSIFLQQSFLTPFFSNHPFRDKLRTGKETNKRKKQY